MRRSVWIVTPLILVGIVAGLLFSRVDRGISTVAPAAGPLPVFVSIPPLKFIAERIGGDRVMVTALVRPGANPHTFEPLPDQMAGLSRAKLFFLVGDPSETAWLNKVRGSYPAVTFVQTDAGITKRAADGDHDDQAGGDPHIWLSPRLLKEQARTMTAAFAAADPAHATRYQNDLLAFTDEMDALDGRIGALLASFKGRSFIVFHPSWGYFADEYGLKQMPIEVAGKEPGAQHLAAVTDIVRHEKVSTLFVAPQFPVREAQAIADATGAKVVTLDPLAEDIVKNLWSVAEALATSFGGTP